jgi:flagellar assembly protein FliH
VTLMLSKLLKETGGDIQPVVLRETLASARSGALQRSAGNDPLSIEISTLKNALGEMKVRAGEQAKQSYDGGFRAGETAARQRLEAEFRGVIDKLGAAVYQVAETRAEIMRAAEADVVRLALEIAKRILHREISNDGSALESLIQAAVRKLQAQEIYRVRVHPDQENLLKTCLQQAGRSQGIAVVADPLQSKGGALFEIGGGTLDASVETQVREIERGLMDQLDSRV